jgi:hypothetical protein
MQNELDQLKDEIQKLKIENNYLSNSLDKIQNEFSSYKSEIVSFHNSEDELEEDEEEWEIHRCIVSADKKVDVEELMKKCSYIVKEVCNNEEFEKFKENNNYICLIIDGRTIHNLHWFNTICKWGITIMILMMVVLICSTFFKILKTNFAKKRKRRGTVALTKDVMYL